MTGPWKATRKPAHSPQPKRNWCRSRASQPMPSPAGSPALCSRAKVLSGDITAANAAVAADAAAFCIVVSERVAADLALPKVELISAATKGSIPEEPGLAPLVAIGEVFRQSGLKASGLHRAEIMEAYAVQAIACVTGAEIAPRIVNRGGGALARGHPIGASGAINAVRLWHELVARGSGTGLAAIAAAGGSALPR
ncbi:hypothetical protein [Sulfitobacter faviae]|uniref:hypothetical protein n=1 Tax=Sulfitobacter faviae TaxID=1775881 RepID=UPI0031B9D797